MKTNKELAQAYKLIKPQIGVFQIKNEQNGKLLIGGSTDLRAIWNRNKTELNFGSHRNKNLQTDWNTFGENAFTFTILSEIEQKEGEKVDYPKQVKTLEGMFIEELQPFGERGYH